MTPVTYFLDNQTHTATLSPIKTSSSISYSATEEGAEATFDITFPVYTELAGFAKLCLWMSCDTHDDMDVFVLLGRVSRSGKAQLHVNFPVKMNPEKLPRTNVLQFQGPTALLRASHREWTLDGPSYAEVVPPPSPNQKPAPEDTRVWDGRKEFWHPHVKSEKLPKGQIVKLEFTTWPLGLVFEEGETMRVRVSGRDMCFIEAPGGKLSSEFLQAWCNMSKLNVCSTKFADGECWEAHLTHRRGIWQLRNVARS